MSKSIQDIIISINSKETNFDSIVWDVYNYQREQNNSYQEFLNQDLVIDDLIHPLDKERVSNDFQSYIKGGAKGTYTPQTYRVITRGEKITGGTSKATGRIVNISSPISYVSSNAKLFKRRMAKPRYKFTLR